MQFNSIHLLTTQNMQKLAISKYPNQKAKISTDQLKYYILITNNKHYKFNFDNIYYTEIESNSDQIITIISLYIETSFKYLDKTEQEALNYISAKTNIFSNKSILEFLPRIKTQLTNNDIDFGNAHFNQPHLRNGLFDINNLEFRKSIFEQDYIVPLWLVIT